MSKHKKRRVRWVSSNPISIAITGVRKLNDNILSDLRLMELSSIEAIASGKGGQHDLSLLAGMAKLTEILADNGIGVEAKQIAIDAQEALHSITDRSDRIGKLGVSMAELDALRTAFDAHDQQRQMVSHSAYEKFLKGLINSFDSSVTSKYK